MEVRTLCVTLASAAIAVGAVLCTTDARAQDGSLQLRVHQSGRYLVDGAGQPFFWLGDTAWGLFTTLTDEEAAEYLDDRAEKGFNVVQAVLAWRSPDPNAYGDEPWIDGDPANPNPAYFDHVETIVEMAAERGIVMALLPAWGDFVTVNERINEVNAREYGSWLGAALGEHSNIVWVLGGDRLAEGYEDVFRLIAGGIEDAEAMPHLMTYHPRGGGHSSSEWFHEDAWLDLNMIQSSHSIDYPEYRPVLRDYELQPVKPTLVGEPRYENIHHGLRGEGPRIDDHQVRKAAWQAVLSGACGHTYGANGIFQFAAEGEEGRWKPEIDWRRALDLPGARHVGVLRSVMTSLDWHRLRPAQEMIADGGDGGSQVVAACTPPGDFALVYFPELITPQIDLARIGGEGVRATWINPRTGERSEAGEFEQAEGMRRFMPPTGNEDPDWVLLLESARPDTESPTIVALQAGGDPERVRLCFSEPVDPASATNAANYAIDPGVTVAEAELQGDRVVMLTTSPMQTQQYTLTVRGVADRWVTPNVAEGLTQQFTWTEQSPRVAEGLIALYLFEGVEDELIPDESNAEPPLPLVIEEGSAADALAGELIVSQDSLIASQRPAEDMARACMQSNAITVEAWIMPQNLEQGGPARIVTLSRDAAARNFTLGQEAGRYVMRLRTTETSENGIPPLETPDGAVTLQMTHVVYTRDPAGTARTYLDGVTVAEGEVAGDLSNWADDFRFALANELTRDRTWLGSMRLVAVYNRALSEDEVRMNFDAGPDVRP